jgi:hypothetical protein
MILNLHVIFYFFKWLDQDTVLQRALSCAGDQSRGMGGSGQEKKESGLYKYRGHGINGES